MAHKRIFLQDHKGSPIAGAFIEVGLSILDALSSDKLTLVVKTDKTGWADLHYGDSCWIMNFLVSGKRPVEEYEDYRNVIELVMRYEVRDADANGDAAESYSL